METPSPAARCVTVLLPPGVSLSTGAACALLTLARRHAGAAPWPAAAVDVLRARRGTLLIARRVDVSAHLAPWALPYLHKYFTD